MNRVERRNLAKKIKKVNKTLNLGLNKTQLKDYIKFKEEQLSSVVLFEGDRVMIDYNGITSRVDYNKRRPASPRYFMVAKRVFDCVSLFYFRQACGGDRLTYSAALFVGQ